MKLALSEAASPSQLLITIPYLPGFSAGVTIFSVFISTSVTAADLPPMVAVTPALKPLPRIVKVARPDCRCKMRMSGLSKVEMSAFIGGRGPHGNGANRFEPTRAGQIARATRGQAEADHADRSRQAAEDQRSPYPSAAVSSGGTRRPSGDPWITRTKIKPQVSR